MKIQILLILSLLGYTIQNQGQKIGIQPTESLTLENEINKDLLNLNNKVFFFEDSDNVFYQTKRSIVEFNEDKVFIIDYPANPGGMVNYFHGSFQLADLSKERVNCDLNKSVTFSLNIGLVVWYQENCNLKMEFSIDDSGQLVRSRYSIRNARVLEMNYKEYKKNEIPFDYECLVPKLTNFNERDKLKPCDYLKNGIKNTTSNK